MNLLLILFTKTHFSLFLQLIISSVTLLLKAAKIMRILRKCLHKTSRYYSEISCALSAPLALGIRSLFSFFSTNAWRTTKYTAYIDMIFKLVTCNSACATHLVFCFATALTFVPAGACNCHKLMPAHTHTIIIRAQRLSWFHMLKATTNK